MQQSIHRTDENESGNTSYDRKKAESAEKKIDRIESVGKGAHLGEPHHFPRGRKISETHKGYKKIDVPESMEIYKIEKAALLNRDQGNGYSSHFRRRTEENN